MREYSLSHCLSLVLICSCLVSLSSVTGRSRVLAASGSLNVKAVNLGGWLVTEGWIKPSLFDGIANKDMLDGTQIQLKSVKQQMYLCAESGGGTIIVANRTAASGWETFKLWRVDESTFNFRVFNGQFIGLDSEEYQVVATATKNPSDSETFQIIRNTNTNRVRIIASNGFYIQANSATSVTADYSEDNTSWGDDDPSVFEMKLFGGFQGEFQLTNGYGTDAATAILRNHWSTFIVENDFKFISSNGLNAVRIPVGWWIASDPNPPKPFVGGSLQALDNAFNWAEKYNLRVIVDLHAAPGSQNGYEHSATRDGSVDWGTTDESITQTVNVIDFLASRYAGRKALHAIELLNEPLKPDTNLESLKKYYQAGYYAVRRRTKAYVIMSNRVAADWNELLSFTGRFRNTVFDVHFYNMFNNDFKPWSVDQNINFVNSGRKNDLNSITVAGGPLVFVGEWTAEWYVEEAGKDAYQRFAQAQLNVYGQATFGWAYWSLQNVQNHWNLTWMISNGYISLK